jgi:signal transduction histidine kinase
VLGRDVLDRDPTLAATYLSEAALNIAPEDLAGRAYLHANECWTAIVLADMEAARIACERSVDIAELSNDDWALTKAYGAMAVLNYQLGRLMDAYAFGRKSVDAALRTGQAVLIANQYNSIGLIVRAQGAYQKSLDYFVNGLEVLDRYTDSELYMILSFNVGLSYADLGEHELAKDFYQTTLAYMQEEQRYAKELTALIYIAIADIALGTPEVATASLTKALQRPELQVNKGYLGFAYAVLGEAYLAAGDLQRALGAYATGMEYAERQPNTFEQRRLAVGYARALLAVGEIELARTHIEAAIKQLREEDSQEMLAGSLMFLAELEERAGNYRESLLAHKEAHMLKAFYQNQALEHQLAVLRADFELEEKESALAKADRERIIRNGIAMLALALALMVYLVVTRRVEMQRARERAEHAEQLETLVAERTQALQEQIEQANRAEEGRIVLERQLGEAEKLRVLGQLTGGVAHDFNNLLTVVLGSAELLRKNLGDDPKNQALVDHIVTAASSGADITKALMAYARQQPLELETVALKPFLRNRVALIGRTLGSMINLKLEIDQSPEVEVLLDGSQLTTALLNLAINARDAQQAHGEVVIELSQRGNRWAVIAVRDEGVGMSTEEVARAVEPFYTTKSELQGNGLGLSMVYGFSRQLGGDLEIDSQPGVGTEVRIVLPLAGVLERTGSNARLSLV